MQSNASSAASLLTPSAAWVETASRLRDAYRGGAIAPLRSTLSAGDVDGAYAVQKLNTGVSRCAPETS